MYANVVDREGQKDDYGNHDSTYLVLLQDAFFLSCIFVVTLSKLQTSRT
jgi:isoprenylcysteine carboxyl methyltransferase (ICMT) family protein YpbQ